MDWHLIILWIFSILSGDSDLLGVENNPDFDWRKWDINKDVFDFSFASVILLQLFKWKNYDEIKLRMFNIISYSIFISRYVYCITRIKISKVDLKSFIWSLRTTFQKKHVCSKKLNCTRVVPSIIHKPKHGCS